MGLNHMQAALRILTVTSIHVLTSGGAGSGSAGNSGTGGRGGRERGDSWGSGGSSKGLTLPPALADLLVKCLCKLHRYADAILVTQMMLPSQVPRSLVCRVTARAVVVCGAVFLSCALCSCLKGLGFKVPLPLAARRFQSTRPSPGATMRHMSARTTGCIVSTYNGIHVCPKPHTPHPTPHTPHQIIQRRPNP